ncbi:MFS transporter [Candidatus Bathyarchaeota archaeon]|nr:MFS transporter [Candidatus Bathyarchaeota archaeon]
MTDPNPDKLHDSAPETNPPAAGTDPPPPKDGDPEPPYTVFSAREKRMILAVVGFSMLFSPLTANIYFPAMTQLQSDLDSSAQLINLTITTYLIFQAVAPALFGDVADSVGRRPAFLVMFAVYAAANLGLALQNSFAALLVLRMVQSLGCSATVAVSYGVIADITTAADRGGAVGAAMVATNLGPALAPLIGGAILSGADWRWIFWFLLLCGALVFIIVLFLLPETARSIVGNGASLPRAWRRPLLSVMCGVRIPKGGDKPGASMDLGCPPRRVPNPLRSVRVLFHKDSSVVALISGVFYMVYYCVQAFIAVQLKKIYGFSDAVIGACYLSIGIGVVVGGYLNGRLLDRSYKALAKELGREVDGNKNDSETFPIEKARLGSMVYLQLFHVAVLIGYGWVMEKEVVSGSHSLHRHHIVPLSSGPDNVTARGYPSRLSLCPRISRDMYRPGILPFKCPTPGTTHKLTPCNIHATRCLSTSSRPAPAQQPRRGTLCVADCLPGASPRWNRS